MVQERGKTEAEIEHEIDQQTPTCPLHAFAPTITVRISSFASETEPESPSTAVASPDVGERGRDDPSVVQRGYQGPDC